MSRMHMRNLTSMLLLSFLLLGCGGTTPSPMWDNHPEESSRMAIYRVPPPRRLDSDPATKAATCRDLLALIRRFLREGTTPDELAAAIGFVLDKEEGSR